MTPPKRHQSQTERDMAGLQARKEREAAPQEFASEEDSMAHEVEERREIRSKRGTDERIGRLEEKHDALHSTLTETRIVVAEMSGKLDVLPQLVDAVRGMADRSAAREHVTFTAQVDVDKARQLDNIDAKKDKRKLYMQIAGAVLGGGVLMKLLAAAGVL